ncbi:MAG: hypothetical protein Q7T55_23130, partial [Solirubrobacteraceae bacterium]|nr:hypothetical protein [Solirubrobacteraceae bacterium]
MTKLTLIIIGIISIILITFPSIYKADDVYTLSDNIITKNNDYKIISSDNILSDIVIDNSSIYFYSKNYLYGINNSNG